MTTGDTEEHGVNHKQNEFTKRRLVSEIFGAVTQKSASFIIYSAGLIPTAP
jgi:hypothetical protein